ncbi:Rab-GTPase-TBC domain-containing protein 4 [Elsinoe australis]|uniref:Rab-GTPase-TBC domain-containing protein 4 n=1 Tax=Elsinoe australis TaxID=40998 RepID=A0A4U7B0A8_9PEZI|nr:Rab-GTPase-TBC domain-containing protein 4 [Elsinoe australis]
MATKQASQGGPNIIGDLSGDNKDLNGSESTTRSSNKSMTLSNGGPLSEYWRAEPLSGSERSKVASIIKACTDHDLKKLAALSSTEGGFVEDEVRRMAWPILLGSEDVPEPNTEWKDLPAHKDEAQVALDVNRAFVYYPRNETDAVLDTRRAALTDLIISVLRTHPSLSYFQGYHDIAQVLLLVLGLEPARPALARLSLLKIRDFLLPTITGTESQLKLLIPLLYVSDPDLYKQISGLQPFFALAAVLTMFAHDVQEYGGISRLFDYLLSHDAVSLIYMTVAMITLRKDELLDIEEDEPEMLYAVLSKLPRTLDLEGLIRRTEGLRERFPMEKLPPRVWRSISTFSVLKTTLDLEATSRQDLHDGEVWLDLHAKEIQRQKAREETIKKMRKTAYLYRKPASAVVLAVFVGALSVWLGRSGNASASPIIRLANNVQQRVVHSIAQALGFRI